MKGVPLRLEIGPKDLEKGQCVLVRRDTREKITTPLSELKAAIPRLLQEIHDSMYAQALARREEMTYTAATPDEFRKIAQEKPGLIRAMWCGEEACEAKLKDETGVTSRCMPFDQTPVGDVCACCGGPAKKLVIWGKAY